MKILINLTLLISLLSCGQKKSDIEFFDVKEEDFSHLINNQRQPSSPDLGALKTIQNRDYPIEIALFNDGTWYYDLPNLDTGRGTWKYEDHKIKLHAKRILFDMDISIISLKENAKEVGIRFTDRFGPQLLKTEKVNFPD